VQRVLIEFVGAHENVVEHGVVVGDVAQHQSARELTLISKMIEKAALGDAGPDDQFFDRGGGKPFVEDGGFGELQDALARLVRAGGWGIGHATVLTVESPRGNWGKTWRAPALCRPKSLIFFIKHS
jgi:hypothetical protein